jgi:predicted HTH domain antitoxin
MFAIESYKKGKASIGKAAELAGVSISEMINMLSGFRIESNMDHKDYLDSLENLKRVW